MVDRAYNVPPKIITAQKYIYEPAGLVIHGIAPEEENREYAAYAFTINSKLIKFRTAKITPKKIGQFVAFYKRDASGLIIPCDLSDHFDLLVVSVNKAERLGQFVFPKSVLYEHGVISNNHIGGKRAMRVYPPWDMTKNLQAQKTQSWQLRYFCEVKPNEPLDIERVRQLYT